MQNPKSQIPNPKPVHKQKVNLDTIKPEEVLNLSQRHRPLQIALVIENKKIGTHQLLLLKQFVQFLATHFEPLLVRRVNHPNEPVGFLKEISPVSADGLLSADVPQTEFVSLEIEGLDLETQSGADGVDVLVVEFLDYGGLAW